MEIIGLTDLLNVLFYAVLQAPPLELDCDELVAAHHRVDGLFPSRSYQRTSTSLTGLELGWVLIGLVVLLT